jgi:hypothetical protein
VEVVKCPTAATSVTPTPTKAALSPRVRRQRSHLRTRTG